MKDVHLYTAVALVLPWLCLKAWKSTKCFLAANGQQSFVDKAGSSQACKSFLPCRLCGSPDLFGPYQEQGFPGGLALERSPFAGFNAASSLGNTDLAATVSSILPPDAPLGQDFTLKKTLLFASLISQVVFPSVVFHDLCPAVSSGIINPNLNTKI